MFHNSQLNTTFVDNNLRSFNGTSESTDVFSPDEAVAVKFVLCLIALVGLFENVVVIFAILTSDILLDVPSNWFVLSLAFADVLACIVVFPHLIGPLVSVMDVYGAFVSLAFLSSSNNLFLLTFNRFLSIYDSLKYPNRMTRGLAKRLVLVPWGIAVFLAIGDVASRVMNTSELHYTGIVYFTLTSVLTIGLNIYMFKKARDQRNAINRLHESVMTGQKKNMLKEYRAVLRLMVVTLTHFGTCIPSIIFTYSNPTRDATKSGKNYASFGSSETWIYLMMLLSSVLDPLVYFINGQEFKRFLAKAKRRLIKRDRVIHHQKGRLKRRPFVIRPNRLATIDA